MSQAEKTLLRYQYVMANTTAVQGDFLKTAPTWSNQLRMLGQNFERLGQVIGSGFIAWLRPLVVTINSYMDSIIASVQRVVNALGQIFGWEMIVDTTGAVVDDVEGIADAYDDATGAAKKFKQQLLGIDELSNLTTKDGGSGSADSAEIGGGGVNIISPGGIEFKPIESDIKDLYSLGKKFSDGLANLLPDSWDEIYKKARNFGKGLADFLNGLIQPDTFKKLGKTVAGAIMTAIISVKSFATKADWAKWGESISEGINGFLEEFDGGELADTLDSLVQGLFRMFLTAASNIKWEEVFVDLYDFLSNIDIETLGITIGTVAIIGLGNLSWTAFTTWLSAQLTPLVTRLIGIVTPALVQIGAYFATFALVFAGLTLSVSSFTKMWENGYNIVDALIKDLGIAIIGLGALILAVAMGIPAAVAAPVIAVVALITAAVTSIAVFIHDHWNEIAEFTKKLFHDIGFIISATFASIVNATINLIEGFLNKIIDGINVLLGGVEKAGDFLGKDWDLTLNRIQMTRMEMPKYEMGGFPEQGSLFLAGETYGQSEWVGNINGRTGVTSGAEITGIADAIYSTSAQEMELLRQQNNYLVGILNKEFGISQTQIGKASRGYAKEYYDRTGRQAYQF